MTLERREIFEVGKKLSIESDLLEILACPACRGKVELKPDGSGIEVQ